MKSSSLYRLDETQWSFQKDAQEIRLITPGLSDRAADYELANRIKAYLHSFPNLGKSHVWDGTKRRLSPLPQDIQRIWRIQDVSERYFSRLQAASFIYKQSFSDVGVRVYEIAPDSALSRAALWLRPSIPWLSQAPCARGTCSSPYSTQQLVDTLLNEGPFRDPFTQMAAAALQRDETPFVSEHAHAGSYRFVLRKGTLELKHASLPASIDDERAALIAFRDLLKESYEWKRIGSEHGDQLFGYLKASFKIDFDKMLEEGSPLLADHVYKCNIGANHVEIAQLCSLLARLQSLKKALKERPETTFSSARDLYLFIRNAGLGETFSLRDVKGVYDALAAHPQGLDQALAPFCDPALKGNARNLPPDAFHRLMEIAFAGSELMDPPTQKRAEPFFTGRKITHLAISGYKTLGNKNVHDPCRNLAELLHVYPALRASSQDAHYELLAHVVAKKSLQTCRPAVHDPHEKEWRVGRLIPFADGAGGTTRWYIVDGFLNDKRGDVNYLLAPACKTYSEEAGGVDKRPPLIKLYRSTASDAEAENSTDSLLADVNPSRVGSLDFGRGDEYERAFFKRSTMPVWMGYLVLGDAAKAAECFFGLGLHKNQPFKEARGQEENLTACIAEQQQRLGGSGAEAERIFEEFKNLVGTQKLQRFLTQTAHGDEWAKSDKIFQDIHFVGHSLGAALSQDGMYHFGAREGRIPLAGCNFCCFAFDPPGGVTGDENERFLTFGRTHKELLLALRQQWKILYQFEYRDFVPQGGPTWLGISQDSAQDAGWLALKGLLYKPLASAKTSEIVAMPTHGRRFLHIQGSERSREWEEISLSPQELYQFKHSLWLPGDLRRKFGFALTTPRLTEELIRKPIGGTIATLLLKVNKHWQRIFGGLREKKGDSVAFYTANGSGAVL